MSQSHTSRRVRGTTSQLETEARAYRQRQTPVEQTLWLALRNRRLDGLKFRRQHPLGPFILDFCCPEHRLVIELDGEIHRDQLEYDEYRSDHLAQYGYRVLRFQNEEVSEDLDSVLEKIAKAVRDPGSSPSSQGGS